MKKIFSWLISSALLLLLLVISSSHALAATQNAAWDSQVGNVTPNSGTVVDAVATPDDGLFVQMDAGSSIIMKFPGSYFAEPDGTATPDLEINTYDALYPASAEIFVSPDGITWKSLGVYSDTANILLNLESVGAVKYVKVDQGNNYIDPAYPTLGFDFNAVVALNSVDKNVSNTVNVCSNQEQTGSVVSDVTTSNDTILPTVATWTHSAWTANVPGATWIWNNYHVADPQNGETVTFTKVINVVGAAGTTSIKIAADNTYEASLNSVQFGSSSDLDNFSSGNEDTYPLALNSGLNTLSITVHNPAWPTTDPEVNPAGLLYRLDVNCAPTTGTISGMKYNDLNHNGKKDDSEPGLQGWTIRLLRDNPNGSDTFVTSVVTGSDGSYTFTNVASGTYDVREVHQKGWKRYSKNPKDIVIAAGDNITGVDFGNAQKRKEEKEDTDTDDNRDDQSGEYHSHNGKGNYEKDKDSKDHEHSDNHNENNHH